MTLGAQKLDSSDSSVTHDFLEEVKIQWQATLDAISDPIAIIDKEYNIIKSNTAMAEFTSHKDVKKIIGEKSYRVFASLDFPPKGCVAMAVLKDGQKRDFTYKRESDGKIFEISNFPVLDPGLAHSSRVGSVRGGIVQIYRDRTFQHKMQEKIRQHDKLTSLGLLASGIAHEINNPLSGILLFSQMLLKELPAKDEHYADVVEIEAAAQRCKEIVHHVLEFSRQSPTEDKNKAEVALHDVIQTAMRFSRVLKVAKESRVIYEWADYEVCVMGCRSRLIQVFINIFKNAFQAMPDGGEIFLSQWKQHIDGQSMVVVEVRDTGVGIAEEHLHQIFDPFFTTKNAREGTGLGLAISYGIIKELGGNLEVSSVPNEGTVVRVSLRAVTHFPPLKEVSESPS